MMAYDTEWRVIDKNLAEAIVYDYALFIVEICFLRLVLSCFFRILVGVLASAELKGTTEYVLMEFIVLSLLTNSSNTGLSSKSEE